MKRISFLFLFLIAISLNAQQINQDVVTGVLTFDKSNLPLQETTNAVQIFNSGERKNVLISALLSAAIPGAGQLYNGEWWKTAIFVAVEAALITTAIAYNKKGNDQNAFFENYADENWSVVKYANWLMINKEALKLPVDANITIDPNTNLKPWERVNWGELNYTETRFSHKLPPHGDQQYYELIGKYPQYNHGWADQLDDNTPEYNSNLTPMFLSYAQMRGEANDYYNTSNRMVLFIVINHILSAAEAAWSAAKINSNLSVSVNFKPQPTAFTIEYVPSLNMKLSF